MPAQKGFSMNYFDTCYLVVSEYGIERMTKRRGQIKAGEVGIKVAIRMPEGAFDEPEPDATIQVPARALIGPDVTVELAGE